MSQSYELRRLHEAATPGPWYTLEAPWLSSNMNTMLIAGNRDPHGATSICDFDCQDDDGAPPRIWEDAYLISYLRNHAEHVIALIDAASKRVNQGGFDSDDALRAALKPFGKEE